MNQYNNYGLYGDLHKFEADIEEEANAALTSQTLNADGTPKRPMNAFMIFARRRRPQVSSENQAMRTGEISKLLSKEWVSMPSHEKQFYLEQAKQLKDSFNSKYPDYVYRRRPNNSRKRRRSDPNLRSIDHNFTSDDAASDEMGSGDLEGSPVEYGPSSNSTVERFTQPLVQPRHLLQHNNLNYSYPQTQHQLRSSAYDDVAPQGWPPKVERLPPTWLGNNDQHSGSMGTHRQAPYSPSTPSSPWSNPSNGPTTPSTSRNYFPTLNTPFYPDQPSIADYTISSQSNSHHISTPSPLYEPVSHSQPNMMSKEYAPRVYSSNGDIQSDNSYSSRPLSYPQRDLPRVQVQTAMEYPNSQPSSSISGPSTGYWSRE